MKTVKVMAVVLPFLAVASSCEDPQELVVEQPAITIISSDVLFGPRGGSGTIGFESEEPVTAYSEQPWCSVEVGEGIVSVKAEEYGELENRYSSVFLKSGADSIRVVVQQNGVVMMSEAEDEYLMSDAKGEISFKLSSNGDVSLKSSASWIRCTIADGKVVASIRENDKGHPRNGWFVCSCGNVTDTIRVSQCSAADLYGNYGLYGYDSGNRLVYLPVSIKAGETENSLVVNCTANMVSWRFNAEFIPETHRISITNGQYVGNLSISGNEFYVYMCMLASRNSSFYWNTQFVSEAHVSYDEDAQKTRMDVLPMSYENTAGVIELDSYVFAAFQGRDEETGLPDGAVAAYPAILYKPYFQTL